MSATDVPVSSSSAQGVTGDTRLRAGSISTVPLIFLVLAAAAPMVAVVSTVPLVIGFGVGVGTPGIFLICGITLVCFAAGYAAMSRHISNAGAFYAYIARGLGVRLGLASAYIALVAYTAIFCTVVAFFAYFAHSILDAEIGLALPWQLWAAILLVAVGTLGYNRVDLNARVLSIVFSLEILLLLVFSVVVLFDQGPGAFSFESFNPSNVFSGAPGVAFAFAFAVFIGFEATAIFAEEAKDPKRTVPRATYGAVILISTFYMITSWAMISGASDPVGGASGDPANFAFDQIRHYLGSFGYHAAQILVLTSFAGCALGIHNAASRYFFALGRDGVLPRALGETNRHRSPGIATITQISIAAIIIAIFAIAGADPYLTLGTSMAALASLGILFLQMMVCLAVIGFFRRRDDGTIWSSIVAPTLGALGMAGAIVLILVNYDLVGHTSSEFLNHIPWLLVVVGIGGLAYGTYLKVSRPRKYADVATALESDFVADAFVEMTEPAPAGQPAA
jgi:amino acid transporter